MKIRIKKINIFWMDPNVDNEENMKYKAKLENLRYNNNIKCFKNIKEGINSLKSIKFEETFIIVSGGFYFQFIEEFKDNLKDIYVIPKILVFTRKKTKLLLDKENNEIVNNRFYNRVGFQIKFKDIKNYILNQIKIININKQIKENNENEKNKVQQILSEKEENNELIFEYIDCKEKLVLPSLYKILLENSSNNDKENFSDYLYNKYKNYKSINYLLESINIKEIPNELLSKYYLRIYTDEKSKFYKDINNDLRKNKKGNYLPYIKVLYEGLLSKALLLASNNTLYRGGKLSKDEIDTIERFLKNKKNGLPGLIAFSKIFLSFSKDKHIAKRFLKKKIKDNLFKVFFILEKDNIIDHSLSTHADIEKISFFTKEKEVLFFPFSSFEIKDIEPITMDNENIYRINLKYLGKYIKEFKNEEKEIPNSKFKEEIIKSGLIENKKYKNKNIKQIFNYYIEYKEKIDYKNVINLIYEKNDDGIDNIFGEKFVENNKQEIELIINGKKKELINKYELKKGKNEIKMLIKNKLSNLNGMFSDCRALNNIEELKYLNTKEIKIFSGMFYGCSSLSDIKSLEK